MKNETKTCQNCKKPFVIEPVDFQFYEKIHVPPPTFCPECRSQRRMTWRNERNLYKRTDSRTGKEIFSWLSNSAPVKVWEYDDWISDLLDPFEYGRNIDWSRPFLVQFAELVREVPWLSRPILNYVNSDYSMNAGNMKNCYLVFHADYCEDSMYCGHVQYCKDSCDVSYGQYAEQCYSSFFITKSYQTNFSSNCKDCINVQFSKNCSGCQDCFGCVNLKNQKYHIFNKPYTKEEYKEEIKKYEIASYRNLIDIEKRAEEFWRIHPVKFMTGYSNLNVTGDYITNSKNVRDSFDIVGAEDSRYCTMITPGGAKDCYDFNSYAETSELLYECNQVGLNCRLVKFSSSCWPSLNEVEYSALCGSSSNLFGCIGVRNKQYCILNKQYSKEEYQELMVKIKKHMDDMPYVDKKGRTYRYGEFLPAELSPFSYNETNAYEYFPLSKEEALERGYSWKEAENRNYQVSIKSSDLPDNIKDVDDSITDQVIGCAHEGKCNEICTEVYRIIPKELNFLRRQNIALPRLCSNCRHYQRLKFRNPLKLWHRRCSCNGKESGIMNKELGYKYKNTAIHSHGDNTCPNEFETSYATERPEIIYCESCYNAEVV